MPRAPKQTKPDQHDCCANAGSFLRVRSLAGAWTWFIGGVPLIYCPWCGILLPRRQTRPIPGGR